MNVYLSHGLAALAGGLIQFFIGRFLRTVVIAQVRERKPGRDRRPVDLFHGRVFGVVVLCLTTLGLLGILTTYVVIERQQRAGDCRRDAVLAQTHDTATMLDRLLDPAATEQARRTAVQAWRDSQDDTQRRIRECG